MRKVLTQPDCVCVNLLLLLHTVNSVKFEVIGPSAPIVTDAGNDIILPCYLKPNISAEDMTVEWFRVRQSISDPGTLVHLYQDGKDQNQEQIHSYKERTSLFKDELKKGNTSLKLYIVKATDNGFYQCLVKSLSWYEEARIEVQVKAVGSQPVVSIEGHRDGGMGLVCTSKGWFPEPQLEWLDSKGVSVSTGPPETHRDSQGLYTVKLDVVVKETDTNSFICRLIQDHLNVQMNTQLHIPDELFDHTIPLKVSLGVIVPVLVIVLVVVIIYFRVTLKMKGQKNKEALQEMNRVIHEKDRVIHEKDRVIHEKDKVILENDVLLSELGIHTKRIPDFQISKQHAVDVTLDPDTAHTCLVLSENKKDVKYDKTKRVKLPVDPKRFNERPCVLGDRSFQSQSFYYEVEVDMFIMSWWVGVAAESANRNGDFPISPENGYWILGKKYQSKNIYAYTSPPGDISRDVKLQKVGVFVNYLERLVSFFDAEARSHIYTFTDCNFTGKLLPLLCIRDANTGSSSLTICPVK
ncbi:butyrophilin subfamily 1 member A1-like isoform X2 [Esox lucius]|nr:butyrophilin subfamily 1 member A1-like isoform X2 [Esox lucius]